MKELYSDLQRGNFPPIRYLKSIWSHSALQSLGGTEGLLRQYVLWETSIEIIIMILLYALDGHQKLDICFSALKLYIRFMFSHIDHEAVVKSFRENVSTVMVRFFNRFCTEYSHLIQGSLKLEIVREDVENIGWILFSNDPMASSWSLDKLNENPVDEVKVRQAQILFLGVKFEDFPVNISHF